MNEAQIKSAKIITLKPNPYLVSPDIPFLYQKRMILMQLVRPRMINGDDVGIGKTLETIIAFTYFKAKNPRLKLIVQVEKNALRQWLGEFQWLTKNLRVKLITAETHEDKNLRISAFRNFPADVIITTYSQVYKYLSYILEGTQGQFVLSCDEPNIFKNHETILHKQMTGLAWTAQRSYGMTATIIENSLEEAFGIMRVVTPGILPSLKYFYDNFCVRAEVRQGKSKKWITTGYKNLDVFRKVIEPAFYGRLQDDPEVEQDLPEAIPKDVEVILSREQSTKVAEAMDRLVTMSDGEIKQVGLLPSLILMQQFCNDLRLKGFPSKMGAKTEAVIELLKGTLLGQRVIIYSKLRSQVELLQKDLNGVGIEALKVTGLESEDQRENYKQRFMSDGSNRCNVLLMNKAGFKSMNLQKGAFAFCYDMMWSYGHYRQFVGRIKRTGSIHEKVGVFRFFAVLHPEIAAKVGTEETIDQYTYEVVMRKKKLWNAITGDETTIESSTDSLLEVFNTIKESYRKKACPIKKTQPASGVEEKVTSLILG